MHTVRGFGCGNGMASDPAARPDSRLMTNFVSRHELYLCFFASRLPNLGTECERDSRQILHSEPYVN